MVISTSPLVKTYTLKEFWDLPDPRDRSKLELIKGVLYMTPPPGEEHEDVASKLNRILITAIEQKGYPGRLYTPRKSIWIDADTYLEPDLMFVSDFLRKNFPDKHFPTADLVVEITSPSSKRFDQTTKSDTYRAMGVREMWLVYQDTQTVEVRYFESDKTAIFSKDETIQSEVLPGINLIVSRIFAE